MIVIGCDIGGMSIKSALVKENGEFIKKFRLPIDHSLSQEDMIHALAKQINEEIDALSIDKSEIKGIGIGCPGAVNTVNTRFGWFIYPSFFVREWIAIPVEIVKKLGRPARHRKF